MDKNKTFYTFFIVGVMMLFLSVILGYSIDVEIKKIGLTVYQETQGLRGALLFFGFALLFPLGMVMLFMGGIALCQKQNNKIIFIFIVTVVLTVFMVSWPAIVGRHHVPGYFGVGGITMLILIVMVAWQWSLYRQHSNLQLQRALDYKALGYFCFALAAWNTCGTLGLPGYGIYPDKMQQAFNSAFVSGQAKVVMLFFVLAWLFTFIGMRLAARSQQKS